MNKQMKISLAAFVILLLSACGPTSAPVATQGPVEVKTALPTVAAKGLTPEEYSKYVGMNYPPLPEGLSTDMGMLIQNAEDYSLSLISDGETKMLWLSKLTHHDASGNAYWEVRDILDLSDVEAGMNLVPDGCSVNGVADHEIFAIGKEGTISTAWRANTTLNVFESIPTTGIECNSDKVVGL